MSLALIGLTLVMAAPGAPAEIEGWHGLRIDRAADCRSCCMVVPPKTFGAKDPDELGLLRRLLDPSGRGEVVRSTGCGAMALRQGIMEHLLRLAIEQKSRGAAEIILRADGPGGVDLGGGEWSETHGERFVFPLLLGAPEVHSLVGDSLVEHVAAEVCTAAFFQTGSEPRDVDALLRLLDARGAHRLAERIRVRCDAVKRELETR